MKNFALILFVLVTMVTLSNNVSAQNPIPSYGTPIIADPTTFEETQSVNPMFYPSSQNRSCFQIKPLSREEQSIYLRLAKHDISATTWARVEIYSLDGQLCYGPYTITEGTLFSLGLVSGYQWGVRVLEASEGCTMDVWIE